ncbi:hypothetical protein ACWEKT_04045 [Nocardia takedensis]|uniref:hypothetical protein n=1 Tax=Nocardia takedensis TaxID=259390 RepID=UPI0002F743F5|nr:hypothetical protein [Nocardia takedensis]
MSGEFEFEVPDDLPTVSEAVASWPVPRGARQAEMIRTNILGAIEGGLDDPELVADLAVGPLVIALGQLEVQLAEARRYITHLEQRLSALER